MLTPSRLLFLPALALSLAAAFLLWRWLGTPVALPEVPGGRLQCLSYTPFEPGDASAIAPGWVPTARIESDIDTLSRYTGCLRVYTPIGNTPRVVATAASRGIRILLGVWIGRDRDQNEKEIAAAIDLAHRYPQAVAVIVLGNEVLLRRELTGEQLAALISSVRTQSPVPVAYADVAHFIEASAAVVNAADLLLIHLLPYWDDPQPPAAGDAVDQVIRQYDKFRARFPGKAVMIGETGWPSKGRMRGPGKPSLVNEALFVRGFAARAAELGIKYNLIEAIDQPWKRPPEGTVGGYWGILDQHRAAKFPLQGPVSAWPHWQRQFMTTAAVIVVSLAAGLRLAPGFMGWVGLSVLSLMLGLSLVLQWDFIVATRLSALAWVGGGVAALGAIVASALLASRLRGAGMLQVASLAELGRARYAPLTIVRCVPLRNALFIALVMTAAAWFGLTLAFAPRFRDIPLAQFALPALAIAILLGRADRSGHGDRREEAMLAAIILVTGVMQLEVRNPESAAWLAISVLLAAPWLASLRAELVRVRSVFAR